MIILDLEHLTDLMEMTHPAIFLPLYCFDCLKFLIIIFLIIINNVAKDIFYF